MCPDQSPLDVDDHFVFKGNDVHIGGANEGELSGTRTSTTNHILYYDGEQVATNATNSGTVPNCPVALGGRQTSAGVCDNKASGLQQLNWMGGAMTGADILSLAQANAALCSALGRQL